MNKCFQLLGRHGDLCTLLPVLKHEFDVTGVRPKILVAKDYESLLDGVSYVERIVWPHSFDRVHEASSFVARRLSGHQMINCSVYGAGLHIHPEMWSFDREIWNKSGCPVSFGRLPLVFDQRDYEREKKLADSLILDKNVPVILTAFSGISSPFHGYEKLHAFLRRTDYQIIDISHVRAERPYDLLGLYDRAMGLVATDSFPLHLAAACPKLKTVALITDGPTPWHRSAWRPHHRMRLLYSEAVEKNFPEMLKVLEREYDPIIQHVTTYPHAPDGPTAARLKKSMESRASEMQHSPHWYSRSIDSTPDRRSSEGLPYMRDIFEEGLNGSRPDDIVCYTNADVGFVSGITGLILDSVRRTGCCFAHRWDITQPIPASVPVVTEFHVKRAHWYAGSDLFAFSRSWWTKYGYLFPDMIVAREGWDMILRNLMKRSGGQEIHQCIWHQWHPSFWEVNKQCAGNVHNLNLAAEWIRTYGGHHNDWQGEVTYK